MMRIALLQARGTPGDVGANVAAVARAATEAAARGARLLITPEAFLTGYDVGDGLRDMATPELPGVAGIARDANIAILAGWAERHGELVHNAATLVGADGTTLLTHRKLHLYGDVDRAAFDAGDELHVAELEGLQVGVLVCFDVEYPEAVRALALRGAQLVAVPTSLMAPYDVVAQTIVPARAAENQIFVAYANRVGRETTLDYVGQSTVAGPSGEIVARAPADEEALLIADVDPEEIARARSVYSYLDERRPALYGISEAGH
jgi:predicted amidohydrolase